MQCQVPRPWGMGGAGCLIGEGHGSDGGGVGRRMGYCGIREGAGAGIETGAGTEPGLEAGAGIQPVSAGLRKQV